LSTTTRPYARYFSDEGFHITTAENGTAMRECIEREKIDLVLLDLVLPGEDGIQLARAIRARSDVAIIMLTGRSDMVDRVVGLEVGADDYISKPFHLREVHARVKSVLRRLRPVKQTGGPAAGPEETIGFDGWRLDVGRRQLTSPQGADIPLTTGEFDLLLAFTRRPGRVLNRDTLMEVTRGRDWEVFDVLNRDTLMEVTRGRDWEVFDRSIDAQVSRLRKNIERDAGAPSLIKSVRGVGYVFTSRIEAP
jgi:DNA-binding response OmpR family regulator